MDTYPKNLPENDKIIWDYIASRSYRVKYWKILSEALENGTFNKYNLNSVFAGELEFEDVRVKNNLPGYYQDYDLNFLENIAGKSMVWRPNNSEFVHKPPSVAEIALNVVNVMNKYSNITK